MRLKNEDTIKNGKQNFGGFGDPKIHKNNTHEVEDTIKMESKTLGDLGIQKSTKIGHHLCTFPC